MPEEKCSHVWEMANVAAGLIVVKKCFHCSKVSTCFCFHDKAPLEESHEDDHFWDFMEAEPAFHFDLRCSRCGTLVKLDELVGLVTCVGCDEQCKVYELRQELERDGVSVVIALGRRPIDERKQIGAEKIALLQEYFDRQADSLKSKIKVVPHEMVRNIASCYADVISERDCLFAAAPNNADHK